MKPIEVSQFVHETGGKKFDENKPSMALIPYDVLWDVAEVLNFGAKKYGKYQWTKGFEYTRLVSGILRHITQWLCGINKDDETGKSHLAHALCGLLMLAAHEKRGLGIDDRDTTAKADLKMRKEENDQGQAI